MNGYLLDTDHCSRFLDGHPVIVRRMSERSDALVATCVIVLGELVFMAQRSERRETNLLRVHKFLKAIGVCPVDEETADIYGRLKADILDRFGPREKAKRRKTRIETLGFSDNDVWIAAIAECRGLILVSADSDFERISQVGGFAVERWWTPRAS